MNRNTRLSEALDAGPDVLEWIISLNEHDFARLRNPLMRKVMPVRIKLGRIAAMVGMPEREFLAKLHEVAGLPYEEQELVDEDAHKSFPHREEAKPEWLEHADFTAIHWVDVTPLDAVLGDPMPPINIAVNGAKPGEIVGVKHMWEPQPLFDIWSQLGLQFWSEQIGPDLWHVYIHRPVKK